MPWYPPSQLKQTLKPHYFLTGTAFSEKMYVEYTKLSTSAFEKIAIEYLKKMPSSLCKSGGMKVALLKLRLSLSKQIQQF